MRVPPRPAWSDIGIHTALLAAPAVLTVTVPQSTQGAPLWAALIAGVLLSAGVGMYRFCATRLGAFTGLAAVSALAGTLYLLAQATPGACAPDSCTRASYGFAALAGMATPVAVWLFVVPGYRALRWVWFAVPRIEQRVRRWRANR